MFMATDTTPTYIFNPEHDLALAYGTEGYTAPPRARILRRDLQMLPAWYCRGGKAADILSQNVEEDTAWLDKMNALIDVGSLRPIALNRLQCRHSDYRPWGWDLALRRRLLNACVDARDLPPRAAVLKLQELSHRRTAAEINRLLADMLPGMKFPPAAVEVASVDEIRRFNAMHPQCYIKAPRSGSGKGVYRVLDADCRSFVTWAQGIINRQGSIMCEVPLRKVLDFAMEFECNGGRARFAGYSVFSNDSHCSYDSGIVALQETLGRIISSRLQNPNLLPAIQASLCDILTRIVATHYNGPLGIDMMVYDDRGTMRIAPCVEMNLRMTMGAVAIPLADRLLAHGSCATFKVTYHKSADELTATAESESRSNPPRFEGGKLASGFMQLTPTYPGSRFLATLTATKTTLQFNNIHPYNYDKENERGAGGSV